MALGHDKAVDLYEVIRLRYEPASTIVTSNRALDELPTPLLSSAALDRLLDDAHVIVIEGDSYRNPPPDKRQAKHCRLTTKKPVSTALHLKITMRSG